MRCRARFIASFSRDKHGAAAVEFAIVSVVFITFMFGIAYTGIILFTNAALHWAVERTIREASINTSATQSQISSTLNGFMASVGLPAATVSYSIAPGAFPVAHISATLTRSYTIPFIPTLNLTYTADAYAPQGA